MDHSRVLEAETSIVEYASLLFPEALDEDQVGAARMVIRHAFRSGYTLGPGLDPIDMTEVTISQLISAYDLSEKEAEVAIRHPEIGRMAINAYVEGRELKRIG